MKPTSGYRQGYTLIELITSVGIIVLVGWGMLQPAVAPGKGRGQRVKCVNNLKNLALGARIFANDNDNKLPSALLATQLADKSITAADYFRVLSNELSTARILVC